MRIPKNIGYARISTKEQDLDMQITSVRDKRIV